MMVGILCVDIRLSLVLTEFFCSANFAIYQIGESSPVKYTFFRSRLAVASSLNPMIRDNEVARGINRVVVYYIDLIGIFTKELCLLSY